MKRFFGTRIREAREARGYTQKELAKKLGLEGNSLARVERGEAGLGWAALELLPEALGEPAAYFFSNQAPSYQPKTPTPEECLEILAKAIRQPVPADPLFAEFVTLWGRLDESQRASTVRVTRDRLSPPQPENAVPKPKKA